MGAIKFICKTDNVINHYEIKNKCYLAGAAIIREKVKDLASGFDAELEVMVEGGTLFKELKEFDLVTYIQIIE